jgi:dTDP-alpha-D-glucuronic acid decarboxylase
MSIEGSDGKRMSRVVVTGGCGFLGSHLVQRLVVRGDDVLVFDNAPPAEDRAFWRGDADFVQGDVRDFDQLARAFSPGADVVYHLAAVVGVDQYLARPLDVIDVNFTGTRNVLDLAARVDAKVVISSTSEIFGKNPAVPWPDDGDRVLGPTSTHRWGYSSSKALAEHLALAYYHQHGLATTIVRYFNAYGPGQRPAYIISRSIHRALNGLPLIVYDRGDQTRCFTYVDDAVEGTILAGASPAAIGEAFNIGSTVETTVRDVVELVAKQIGVEHAIVPVNTAESLSSAYQDLSRRVPQTIKAQTTLGWKCVTSLPDGLTATIDWARKNPWWLALPDSGAS